VKFSSLDKTVLEIIELFISGFYEKEYYIYKKLEYKINLFSVGLHQVAPPSAQV
jgi:hypothetical protein